MKLALYNPQACNYAYVRNHPSNRTDPTLKARQRDLLAEAGRRNAFRYPRLHIHAGRVFLPKRFAVALAQ